MLNFPNPNASDSSNEDVAGNNTGAGVHGDNLGVPHALESQPNQVQTNMDGTPGSSPARSAPASASVNNSECQLSAATSHVPMVVSDSSPAHVSAEGSSLNLQPAAAPTMTVEEQAGSSVVGPEPVRPKTRPQSGISKKKVYTDGTIRYGCFSSSGEPQSLEEALGSKH